MADAGPDQTSIEPGSTVTITGTGAGTWSQTAGPTVTLVGSGATRTFTAPATVAGVTCRFAYGGDSVDIAVLPVTERAPVAGAEVPVLVMLA